MMDGASEPSAKIFLWKLFKRINCAPADDLFDKISDEDIIEVYFTDHTPIFRSIKFYRETSYTVDEALCSTWYDFSKRSLIITLKVMRKVLTFIKKNHHLTMPYNVPGHVIEEVGTEFQLRHWMQMKYISGAHKNGKLAAVISISSIDPLGRKAAH